MVRAEGAGEPGLGRGQEKIQTDEEARAGRSRRTAWEGAQQEGWHGRDEVPSLRKAQASRNATKRVILSNDITEPLLIASPNIIIRSL